MPINGKFIGNGICIKELQETYSFEEIIKMNNRIFKDFLGFFEEKELEKLLNYMENNSKEDYKIQKIINILSKLKEKKVY